MIISISLKNWKSHKKTDLEFGDGTNVLVGSMGSGKSSVLDAIAYALFGTLPGIKGKKFKLDDLLMNRPDISNRAEVEVRFRTPDDEEFVVKRCIERGKGTVLAELRKSDGEILETGSSERVTEQVSERLKITSDIYERAIYSEQNQLDQFLQIGKGKRREHIDELLGIKRFETARKNMTSLANSLQRKANEKDREVQILKRDESERQIPKIEQEINDLLAEAEVKDKESQALERKLNEFKIEYEKLRGIKEEISQMETKHSVIKAKISQLKTQMEKLRNQLGDAAAISLSELRGRESHLLKDYENKKIEVQREESNLNLLRNLLGELRGRSEGLKRKISELSEDIAKKKELQKLLEQNPPDVLEKELNKIRERKNTLEKEDAIAKSKISELEKAMRELEKAAALCPVCESPLDEVKKRELLSKRRDEISSLSHKVESDSKILEQLKKEFLEKEQQWKETLSKHRELEDLPQKIQMLETTKDELQQVSGNLEKTSKDVQELENSLDAHRKELESKGKELFEVQQQVKMREDLMEISSQFDQLVLEESELKGKLDVCQAKFSKDKFQDLETLIQKTAMDLTRAKELVSKNKALAAEKRRTLAEIIEKVERIRKMEAKIRYLRELSQTVSALQSAIGRVQVELRRYFLDSVNAVMNDIWDDLYPYGDFVGVRLSVDEDSNDYVLQLRDRSGEWRAVDGGVSGGERSTACLALRVAFAMVLAPSLRWIVFDEPTHNLDARAVQELAKVLRERLPSIVKQVLLITHNEKLEEAVSGFLYRFHRDKSRSEPTRYELVPLDFYESS